MKEIIEKINEEGSFSRIRVTEFAPPGKWAEKIAENLGDKMKTTQLRKVFTAIKQIDLRVKGKQDEEKFNDPSLFMLVPQLAYAKARGFIKPDFYELLKNIIGDGQSGKIRTVGDFKRFSEFMTAIVAYHKQYSKIGGQTND